MPRLNAEELTRRKKTGGASYCPAQRITASRVMTLSSALSSVRSVKSVQSVNREKGAKDKVLFAPGLKKTQKRCKLQLKCALIAGKDDAE